MSLTQLAESIGYSKAKLENFLAFDKIPTTIWDTVGNLSRVSSRTSATIFALSKKGKNYIAALIDLAEEIRKGTGSSTLEKKVLELINGEGSTIQFEKTISLPSGQVIAKWVKGGLQFSKDVPLDQAEIEKMLVQYFEKL